MKRKLAMVTGAQQGIGRAVAMVLARAGCDIIANYHDDDAAANSLADELRTLGVECHLIKADLSHSRNISAMLTHADSIGVVDVLVNNAAIFPRKDFLEVSEELWDEVQSVNLKAPFLCTQHVAKVLVEQKQSGSIINLSSGAAFRGSPMACHYVTSKAGLVGLTRATSLELAKHGIRVNAVAPGLTDTAQPRLGMNESELQSMSDAVPLGHMATSNEVADVVAFLASDASRHVTGQTWHVNGGSYLG